MSKPKYEIEVTQIHKHILVGHELRPKYVVWVFYQFGDDHWSDSDYSYTLRGARKRALKLISKRIKKFEPVVVQEYEL